MAIKDYKGLLRYIGAKWRLADKIVPLFPEYKTYCEPFCGSLAMLFSKQQTKSEIVSDLSNDLINFYTCLREYPEELTRKIYYTPYARQMLKDILKYRGTLKTPLDRAWAFYCANRMGWNAGLDKDSIRVDPRGTDPIKMHKICENFEIFIKRLNNVVIENYPYEKIIPLYDRKDTFFYCDPPYTVGADLYIEGGFQKEDHEKLAYMLNNIKGKVAISYYQDAFIDNLYHGWNKETFTLISRIKSDEKKEVLYLNYEQKKQLSFDFKGAVNNG